MDKEPTGKRGWGPGAHGISHVPNWEIRTLKNKTKCSVLFLNRGTKLTRGQSGALKATKKRALVRPKSEWDDRDVGKVTNGERNQTRGIRRPVNRAPGTHRSQCRRWYRRKPVEKNKQDPVNSKGSLYANGPEGSGKKKLGSLEPHARTRGGGKEGVFSLKKKEIDYREIRPPEVKDKEI